MDIVIQELDPEWTVWAKCPVLKCDIVTHACCEFHAKEAIEEHMAEEH